MTSRDFHKTFINDEDDMQERTMAATLYDRALPHRMTGRPGARFARRARIDAGLLVFGLLLAGMGTALHAEASLAHIFGDDMVLQRERPVPIWGWASAGEAIEVRFGHQMMATHADAKGKWQVVLDPMPANDQPSDLTIGDSSGPTHVVRHGILVGEVWLCSGQSNMEWGVGLEANGADIIAHADHPTIRLFKVPHLISYAVESDFNPAAAAPKIPAAEKDLEKNAGAWRTCTPQTITMVGWKGFSCAAYFFALDIQTRLKVPVGMIQASYGGSDIESFIPLEGYALIPDRKGIHEKDTVANFKIFKQTHPAIMDWFPVVKFNGMINPMVPLAIRGVLWHQGESNVGAGKELDYYYGLKALIGGWRAVWGRGDLPFYYVMTGPYRDWKGDEMPKHWMSQLAGLSIPDTGYVVTTDIGEPWDLHPYRKDVVGHRLALWALAKTYGCKDLIYSGPIYKSMSVEERTIHVEFESIGSGLASRDGKALTHFEVAGADGVFVPASATITGGRIDVRSDAVEKPTAVRFGWTWHHPQPPEPVVPPNLVNREGLPAAPFNSLPNYRPGTSR